MILVAQIAYATRVVGYTFVKNAWLILALEPLHGTYLLSMCCIVSTKDVRVAGCTGVTYACIKTAQVYYSKNVIAQRGLETTAQGVTTVFSYVGTITGQWVGGWVRHLHMHLCWSHLF